MTAEERIQQALDESSACAVTQCVGDIHAAYADWAVLKPVMEALYRDALEGACCLLCAGCREQVSIYQEKPGVHWHLRKDETRYRCGAELVRDLLEELKRGG